MKKAIFLIFVTFVIKVIFSCKKYDYSCGDAYKYSGNLNNVELKIEDNQYNVRKYLRISILYNFSITGKTIAYNYSNLGFNKANATDPCQVSMFYLSDSIVTTNILCNNFKTGNFESVDSIFLSSEYMNYSEKNKLHYNSSQFIVNSEISNTILKEKLSDSCRFIVKVKNSQGQEFSDTTETLYF